MTKNELRAWVATLGLTIHASSPGDGKTRYEFVRTRDGRTVGTAVGLAAAGRLATGYARAIDATAGALQAALRYADFTDCPEVKDKVVEALRNVEMYPRDLPA